MRTTVTLDADVERLLKESIKERGVTFKQALNEAIRTGLARRNRRPTRRFVQKSFPLGGEQNFRWDKALAMAETIQDEEISRRLPLRK